MSRSKRSQKLAKRDLSKETQHGEVDFMGVFDISNDDEGEEQRKIATPPTVIIRERDRKMKKPVRKHSTPEGGGAQANQTSPEHMDISPEAATNTQRCEFFFKIISIMIDEL